MMKMRIAAVLAAVMIGTAALPAVTVFAQGNDPEQTTAAETAAAPETTAVTETAETDAKDGEDTESKKPESEAAGEEEKAEPFDLSSLDLSGIPGLSSLDLSGIPGMNLDIYTDILSELDPEVLEVLLKNPKLMAYLLPTLHVTVTDTSVTVAVDGEEPEEDPVRTGHVRTNGSNLNVRTGPGIGFDIINSLANGTEVRKVRLCLRKVSGAE